MNIEKLKRLETSQDIVTKYAGMSSFGKNRIVYLPLLVGIGLLMFVAMAIFSDLTELLAYKHLLRFL